ncbi:MAG: hypothetical protein PVI87_03720 [Gammaproteobacteria bacterium]|jgi:hypothetical protein
MFDALAPGMLVEEFPGRETPLEIFPEGATAFIGVARRGPVDTAVAIRSLADYDRIFGVTGAETPLDRCVQDFFQAGGERAVVVRVANEARPCTIRLPGDEGVLLLEALSPGGSEFLRASVDYDQIAPSDTFAFNLVIQRLRASGSERVVEQEIYPRLSVQPGAERYVADALMESRLMRVRGATPPSRPRATVSTAPGYPVSWAEAGDDGSDGRAVTDYDLVGSAAAGTGLFALEAAGPLDFVCLPPAPDGRSAGPALLLAALRYCRRRHAMLLLEAPEDANDADQALDWLRRLNVAGGNALAVFPRLAGEGKMRARSALGAVAGALSRQPSDEEPALGSGFRPTHELPAGQRRRLLAAGLNLIARGAGGRVVLAGNHTLAPADCPVPAWRSLSARRPGLMIERTLLHGTRWLVFEPPGPDLAARLRAQLGTWFESLRFSGRLAGESAEAWFVDIDEVAGPDRRAGVEFTVGFAPRRPGDFIIYRVFQGLDGGRLVRLSAERWAITRPRQLAPTPPGVLAPGIREVG